MIRLEKINIFSNCNCSHISISPAIAWDTTIRIDTLFIDVLPVSYSAGLDSYKPGFVGKNNIAPGQKA